MGAGKPKFRIWLTMSAAKNANVTPGNCLEAPTKAGERNRPWDGGWRQGYKNVGIPGANRCRIAVREIDAAVG